MSKIKLCVICDNPFFGRRDARTCSVRCRKALQRYREQAMAELYNKPSNGFDSVSTMPFNVRQRATAFKQQPPKNNRRFGKTMSAIVLGVFGTLALFMGMYNQPPTAHAATSSTLNFSARLLDSSGAVVPDGNYHIEFKIYDSVSSGGSAQGVCSLNSSTDDCWWKETRTTGNLVRVVNGYFNVNLGSVTAFGSSIPWDQQLYLTMRIGGSGGSPSWEASEMTNSGNRIALTGVPYAFTAGKLQATSGSITNQLVFATPSGSNKTLTLPNETGTVCTTGSVCSGYQAANSVTLQNAYSYGSSASDQTLSLTAADGGGVILQDASSTVGNLFTIRNNGNTKNYLNVTATGTTLRPETDGTAFQVQNSGGNVVLGIDTTNQAVNVTNLQASGTISLQGADGGSILLRTAANSGTGASAMTYSGNEITDLTRSSHIQGDGLQPPDSSTGIWEGTTNSEINGGFETNTTGWALYGSSPSTISRSSATSKFGSYSLYADPSRGAGDGLQTNSSGLVSASSGQTWTASVWLKSTDNVQVAVSEEDAGSTYLRNLGGSTVNTNGNWQRVSFTGTVGASTDHLRLTVGTVGNTKPFYIDSFQLEQKRVATPYVETNGATASRALARVQAPTNLVSGSTNVWFAARVRIGGIDGVNSQSIMGFGNSGLTNYYMLFMNTSGIAAFQTNDPTNGFQTATQGSAMAVGSVHTLVGYATSSSVAISLDGGNFTVTSHANAPSGMNHFDIGSIYGSPVNMFDGDVLWAAAGKGALSNADVAAIYRLGKSDPSIASLNSIATSSVPTFVWDGESTQYSGTNNSPTLQSGITIDDVNLYHSGNGGLTLQGATNSTTAFQIQNAAGTSLLTVDTSGGSITLAPQGSGTINLNGNTILSANKSLTITGGATGTRPGSPTDGMVYYDTTTHSLLVYNSAKTNGASTGTWQADRTDAVLVAASNSSQADKDAADYIADGNTGSANDGDQVQINAALTAASGRKVVLLAGTYTADATILILNNTILSGVGKGTIIQLADIDATDNLIENSDQSTGTGIVIRDLSLDGNKAANTGAITQNGIYMNEMGTSGRKGAIIQNIWVDSFETDGINLEGVGNSMISNIVSSSNDAAGLSFPVDTGNLHDQIINSRFQNNGGRGTYINAWDDFTITGNIASGNGDRGFHVAADNSTITGNTAYGNALSGFTITSDNGITFTGNTTYGNTFEGIELGQANHSVVNGNFVYDNSGSTDNDGIKIVDSDYNTISNNIITDSSCTSTCYAIDIDSSASDKNQLSGNRYSGDATHPASIHDLGTNTIYTNQQTNTATSATQDVSDLRFRGSANSSTAFQIQNAGGGSLMSVDSTNNIITLNGNASGQVGSWATTTALSSPREQYGSAIANGYIYIVGGTDYNVADKSDVNYAKINANGTIGTWTSLSATYDLPDTRWGLQVVAANGYLYATGGFDGSNDAQSDVYYTKVNSDGSIGVWQSTTSLLAPRGWHSSVVANGYLYVIGGHSGNATSTSADESTVYYAKLNGNGTVGAWQTNANVLTNPRYGHSSVVANGYLYVIGGRDDTAAQSTVYYAPLNSDGSTGSWSSTTTINSGSLRYLHTSVVANGYLYVIGGNSNGDWHSSAPVQSTVYYAPLNSNGSVGSWSTNVNALPTALDGAKATSANGYIYFLGGSDGSSSVGSTKTTSYYTSTSRVNLFGALDLVGISGENLADGGSGGQLTAGNTKIIGSLDVQGQASFVQNVAVNGDLNLSGLLSLANKSSAPSGIAGAMYYDSTNNKFKCYTTSWVDCDTGGGGGGGTVVMRYVPEFGGAVLSADGSSNSGTLTAGFVSGVGGTQGYKHNYYQWSTAQGTAQDYDIILNVQIPSDYTAIGAASTFKFWIQDPDSGTTNAQVTWTILDEDETSCFSSNFNGSTTNWEQKPASTLGSCSFAANDTMTVKFHVSTTNTAGNLKLGEFQFSYTN